MLFSFKNDVSNNYIMTKENVIKKKLGRKICNRIDYTILIRLDHSHCIHMILEEESAIKKNQMSYFTRNRIS